MHGAGGYATRHRVELLVLASMITVYFFSFFQRVAVPGTIFDELQQAFSASAGAIAGLAAIYLYIYGVMQPVAGILADRLGAARVVLIGGFLLSVGSIGFPLAVTLPSLYAARVVVGLGASLIYVSVAKAVDELFDAKHFVMLMGITLFLGYAGGLAGTLPFERLASVVGWRCGLLAAGLASLGALLGAFLMFRRTGQLARRPGTDSLRAMGVVLRNRASWPIMLTGFGNFAVYFLVQATIGKKFLSDYGGLSSAAAASFTGIMMFVVMTMALLGGFLSRLLGNRRKPLVLAAIVCVLISVVLMLLLLRFNIGGKWFLPCYILLACSSIGSAASNALMKELNPPDAVGTSIGMCNGMAYIAVAIVSSVAGFIMDRYQDRTIRTAAAVIYPGEAYQDIFLFCVALSAGTLVVAAFIRETHGQSRMCALAPDEPAMVGTG